MAKRFTDTGKWEDAWFRKLLPEYQLFWIYILDRCDNAGVWEVDFELAGFFLQKSYNETEVMKILDGRIQLIDDGKKWFIPRFISFQYGQLDESCHPHKPIIKLLDYYKIKGYSKGINTLKTRQDNIRQDKKRSTHPVDNSKNRGYAATNEFKEMSKRLAEKKCKATA